MGGVQVCQSICTGSLFLCLLLSQLPIGLHYSEASPCYTAALHGSLWKTQSWDPERRK